MVPASTNAGRKIAKRRKKMRIVSKYLIIIEISELLAKYNTLVERVGFEPARQGLPAYSISSRALSAGLSHLIKMFIFPMVD